MTARATMSGLVTQRERKASAFERESRSSGEKVASSQLKAIRVSRVAAGQDKAPGPATFELGAEIRERRVTTVRAGDGSDQRAVEVDYKLSLGTTPSGEISVEMSGSAVLLPVAFAKLPTGRNQRVGRLQDVLEEWQISKLALELYARNYEVLYLLLMDSFGGSVPPPSLIEDVHLVSQSA